jgi:hypothetical protein
MEPGGVTLRKITTHEVFKKYTLWLMSDETNEASGQIAPALSLMGETAHRAAEARRRLANCFKYNGKMG